MDIVTEKPRRYTRQSIRDRLMKYRDTEREIDNQIERIENLAAKMVSLQSPVISDMPKSQNAASDKIGSMIAEKDKMERYVRKLIAQQGQERAWIEETLAHLKKADERACIRMRYIDMESWSKVSLMLYGFKKDYVARKDSYLRRTTKVHARALRGMLEYMNEKEAE